MASLAARQLTRGPFGPGGCIVNLGRKGEPEFIGVRGQGLGVLVAINLRTMFEERIDAGVDMPDCVGATLFGRRGFLMIQRGMQVRFYERARAGWRGRDIYSIYTPSYQTGLALADVDQDGRIDILCGNYWIRSPRSFDESWRLFAINTWFEEPDSASVRIAVLDRTRVVSVQSRRSPARAALFVARADRKALWNPGALLPQFRLHHVRALTRLNGKLLLGEANGEASRLFASDLSSGAIEKIQTASDVVALVPLAKREVFVAERNQVRIWSLSVRANKRRRRGSSPRAAAKKDQALRNPPAPRLRAGGSEGSGASRLRER